MSYKISLFMVLILCTGSCALQCYQCAWSHLESDNVLLDFILGVFSEISDEHCRLVEDDDYYEVLWRTCPEPGEGQIARCVTLSGEVTATVKKLIEIGVKYKTVTRDCVIIDKNDPDYDKLTDGCHDGHLPSYGPIRTILDESFTGLNLGNVDFNGKACYSQDSRSGNSEDTQALVSTTNNYLQCYHCTWSHFESDNSALDFVLGVFSKISDDHCRLLEDDDYSQVLWRSCPAPEAGQVAKCAMVSGEVTANVKKSFISLEVKYKTVTRDCIIVDADDPEYTDGCHESLPSHGAIRNVIDESFTGLDLGDVKFEGEGCYSEESRSGDISDTSALVGASGLTQANIFVIGFGTILCLLKSFL